MTSQTQQPQDSTHILSPSFGAPDAVVQYCPPWAGKLEAAVRATDKLPNSIEVTVPPSVVHGIFAHRQWRAGLLLAELVADGSIPVRGRTVLELGAGTGMPSIVAALAGAHSVTSTDYDEPTLIGRLRANLHANLPSGTFTSPSSGAGSVRVLGHTWGTASVEDLYPWDPVTRRYRKFDVVLCADLLWDRFSHQDLVKTLCQVLDKRTPADTDMNANAAEASDIPGVYIVAGSHTGRDVVANFFRLAEAAGFAVEGVDGDSDIYEWRLASDSATEPLAVDVTNREPEESGSSSKNGTDEKLKVSRSCLDGSKRLFDAQKESHISERNGWIIRAILRWRR